VLTALAWALHPADADVVAVDPALLAEPVRPPASPAATGFAGFLDHTPWLNALFFAGVVLWVLRHLGTLALGPEAADALGQLWTSGSYGPALSRVLTEGVPALLRGGWRFLNINVVIFVLLACAVLLHKTPAGVVQASEEAASVLSGIALQFPLYAGIYGIFRATGLATRLGELFVSLCTARTFPTVVYWYSGLVNYFVPSGGAKWTIEAPYLLEAAKTLGVAPEKVVMAYAWGDMATDLIQPFWAIPLLAVAKLEFKDVLGFLLLAFVVYAPLVTVAFWLWG
jgi:short-chain fatty acids transporter